MQRTVVVISAGLGVPSSTRMLADQMGADVQSRLASMGIDARLDVVDLRDFATGIANNMVTGYAGQDVAGAIRRVEAADAMIAVTPTFSASYSGLFKSFFDILDPKFLDGMPVFFGATGGSPRHSLVLDMAIRPLFSYLRAHTMPTAIYASPEDWGGSGENTLERRIGQGAAELAAVIASHIPGAMGSPTPDGTSAAPAPSAGDGPGDADGGVRGYVRGGRQFREGPAVGFAGSAFPDHKARRAQHEAAKMTSLPFEELLAQTQRR
ncbi:FMN reductase [Arthrobacter stackebrandtii]|uniref:FMN reductase n=1 Tax=Arthrobacter stackebrandtii TaxID=272161 RepID=A0ABS4YSW4_9MICC|nr:CE1759 family FMN reductase [Arthrobacter stackebrandtii]MBP2411824.1 FMN reductase [Arthrobacter stackebrandtii]PYG99211.1 NADPH-dependent FMN reductase [Arthrobacter stackebrandtii]